MNVTAKCDNRTDTMCNHTATHLLQAALREVLGSHVEQNGSDVGPERLRFDFTHTAPLTAEERDKVEELVSDYISAAFDVAVETTTPDEARKKGAIALFGEKYGEIVRMVSMEGVSVELCGGTHVKNTMEIGVFKILSESGIASGVRRIEAVTGRSALRVYRQAFSALAKTAEICKSRPEDVPEKVRAILEENKTTRKEISRMQSMASGEEQGKIVQDIVNGAVTHNGFSIVAHKIEGCDIDALRQICDKVKAQLKSGCLLLCGVDNEKNTAQFLCSATDDAVKQGVHAGQIVKEAAMLCGGGGGGKPNHAQAGGKDAAKAVEALEMAVERMKGMLQ